MKPILKNYMVYLPMNGNAAGVTNQRIYFTNVNFLTGKKIVRIQTFINTRLSSTTIAVPDIGFMTLLGLTMVDKYKNSIVDNLSCSKLSQFSTTGSSKEYGLPIVGQFDFEKSYVTIYGPYIPAVHILTLPISFQYEV